MILIHMSVSRVYKYKSIFFEWHDYCGPTFIRRKDGDIRPYEHIGLRQYGELGQWLRLSKDKQELFRHL